MKKIKNNSNGFVLAETLVVAVFLMAIFTLIFANFYPLMGEYEKRETYDDVDAKYSVYWIKRMIEDSSYQITGNADSFFRSNNYVRFECKDVSPDNEKQEICKNMVKALEVKGCDTEGNHCEIYITKYKIGATGTGFKNAVKTKNVSRYQVNNGTKNAYIEECKRSIKSSDEALKTEMCTKEAERREFRSGFVDYIESLPDYKVASLDGSNYRVLACFQHKKDNNNYYSYATIEVSR